MRCVPNHRTDDELLKEYFYRGKDDNNKAWSTRKLDTGRNTFAVQSTHNPATDEICEEMAQMRTRLGLVLEHVTRGAKKINVFNYLSKPPQPNVECYYEEDSYAVNEQTGGFRRSAEEFN